MVPTPVLETGGAAGSGLPPPTGGFSRVLDSIVFPAYVRAEQHERRVRPALAVLFRIAIGPHADYYARRFVRYERSGHSAPSWNWPAFAFAPVWAFYRKLWGYGVACALLPVLGVLSFSALDLGRGGSAAAWWAWAALFCWLIPAGACAAFANTFYYHRIRRIVRRAESRARSAEAAATRLQKRGATDALLALLLGVGILLCVGSLVGPRLQSAYHAHSMRAVLEQVIAAVRPLQRQVEDQWAQALPLPQRPDYAAMPAQANYGLVEAVDLNARTGRLRIDLGDALPELQGKSLLLAPGVDARQKLHWLCIPVDIPAAYVPASCAE